MTAPKTKEPIESFGPELKTALVEGGRRRILVPFVGGEGDGKRKAHTFCRRVNSLRQRMRETNHPEYEIAMRTKVAVYVGNKAVYNGAPATWKDDEDGKRGALVVLEPKDIEFGEDLRKAGISIDRVDQPEHSKPDPEKLDDWIASLPSASENKSD